MTALVSHALCTVADVKELLGIDSGDSSKDNLITRKINQATDMIEGYCLLPYNHHFKEATYTNETFDGGYSNYIQLGGAPVSSVSSFQYRDTRLNEDSWTTIDTNDYFIDSDTGMLLLNHYTWGGWAGFRASYTAGYSTIPSDLSEACATLAAHLVNNSNLSSGSSVQSVREGQRQITYATKEKDTALIDTLGLDEMLDRYVRVSLGAT